MAHMVYEHHTMNTSPHPAILGGTRGRAASYYLVEPVGERHPTTVYTAVCAALSQSRCSALSSRPNLRIRLHFLAAIVRRQLPSCATVHTKHPGGSADSRRTLPRMARPGSWALQVSPGSMRDHGAFTHCPFAQGPGCVACASMPAAPPGGSRMGGSCLCGFRKIKR